jgi:hypothetical protein
MVRGVFPPVPPTLTVLPWLRGAVWCGAGLDNWAGPCYAGARFRLL